MNFNFINNIEARIVSSGEPGACTLLTDKLVDDAVSCTVEADKSPDQTCLFYSPEVPAKRAWILKIVRNEALQTLRKRKDVATDPADLSALAEKPAVTAEDRMVLESLFLELEQDEREIVTLYAVTGMKHREIADMLNLPLSTELSKYQRTLKKLEERWEREMEAWP